MPKSERSDKTAAPDVPVTELWPLEKVWPDPANARLHNPRNLEAIKSSLRRFGQQKPIVVRRDGMILAGNGTYAAIREMGWSEIWLRVSELESIEAAAYALADNRTAELAAWDFEILTGTLRGLQEAGYPLEELGWNDEEAKALFEPDKSTSDDETSAQIAGLEYRIVISCDNEQHQAELLERFELEGFTCRALIS